ncbi:hypothetical protein Sjap_014741 [Stephania japonica]|uniref:Uncharacterized protein n=1 Tax=Stephania japonica TaxID=461633 RepID=A0AAP0NRS2_9MAGN
MCLNESVSGTTHQGGGGLTVVAVTGGRWDLTRGPHHRRSREEGRTLPPSTSLPGESNMSSEISTEFAENALDFARKGLGLDEGEGSNVTNDQASVTPEDRPNNTAKEINDTKDIGTEFAENALDFARKGLGLGGDD